jgi:5S rRNA maturation endonuclease (ribonuclease M5)
MQRVNRDRPCRVCGGYDGLPRGDGRRCTGYVSSDAKYLHCTRSERAGSIDPLENGHAEPTYPHIATGPCRCGRTHTPDLSRLNKNGGADRHFRPDTAAPNGRTGKQQDARIVATYTYTDEQGNPLYRVLRYDPKGFKQQTLIGGVWVWGLKCDRVLYRLPEVIAGVEAEDEIWIAEGEKDVDALRELGVVATCNSGGAGKFDGTSDTGWLERADVVIVEDQDDAGRKHAAQVKEHLHFAKSVRIVRPKEGKDAADHIAAGHGIADFVEVKPEPEPSIFWTPEDFATDKVPDAVVDKTLHEGSITLLTGDSKAGKSYFSIQLAMCVATGESFMGMDCRKGPVIYLSLEMVAGLVRDRMEAISRDTGVRMPRINEEFFFYGPGLGRSAAMNLLNGDGIDLLRRMVREAQPVLIVFDTFHKFTLSEGGDPMDNHGMSKVFAALYAEAQACGAAFLVLDHTAKGAQYHASTSAIGAQSKGASSSTILKLTRDEGTYKLECESHFGSWSTPLEYKRPMDRFGNEGSGCVLMTQEDRAAKVISPQALERLFMEGGVTDEDSKRWSFQSQADFGEALMRAGLADSKATAARRVLEIESAYASRDLMTRKPILIVRNKPKAYLWYGFGST